MSSDERAWVVPESLRAALAATYGPVLAGPAADERIRGLSLFASCGDRVTQRAIELDNLPRVGIVDYKTRRNEPVDPAAFQRLSQRGRRRVVNPAGMVTESLRAAVRELLASTGGLVEVEGEEDLGSLVLVESLPVGATVIYGIPGEGVSFVTVDAAAQANVKTLFAQMDNRVVRLGS